MAGERADSTLHFYKTQLNESKYAYIDDIDEYLDTCDINLEIDNFQYIRHDLSISIKVNMNQAVINDFNYNYVSIENTIGGVAENFIGYYFITKTTQVAPETILIDLRLDTINSLGQGETAGCNPRNFLSKTIIARQHQDRYHKPASWDPSSISILSPEILNRNINRLSEGLTFTPHKVSDTEILQHERNIDWYLIYVSNSDFDKEFPETRFPIKIYLTTGNGSIGYDDHESETVKILKTKEELDITNSRINKLICLPYCPIEHTVRTSGTATIYDFGSNWQTETESDFYLNGYLKYVDLTDTKSMPEFINNNIGSINLRGALSKVFLAPPTYENTKETINESKLLHSDYNYYKATYDSFNKIFKPEDFTVNATTADWSIPINYKQTNTINSKMLFQFDYSNFDNVYTEEDFNNILTVSRNNEETLLNSNYLNYLRNGYNYDIKTRSIQDEITLRNFRTDLARSTLGAVKNAINSSGGAAATVNTAISGADMITSSIVKAQNLVDNSQLQNIAMAAKINDLATQKVSVSGIDDIDLMKFYSGNKLHSIIYRADNYYLGQLYVLFDLTGYVYNNYGKPNVDSRIWYNYIQCDPELDFDSTKGYKQEWLNDLIAKYNNGVTVYHHNNIDGQYDKWNIDQQWENWETWIVEGVNNE